MATLIKRQIRPYSYNEVILNAGKKLRGSACETLRCAQGDMVDGVPTRCVGAFFYNDTTVIIRQVAQKTLACIFEMLMTIVPVQPQGHAYGSSRNRPSYVPSTCNAQVRGWPPLATQAIWLLVRVWASANSVSKS